MPLKIKRVVSDNVMLGIWHIEESLELLLEKTGNDVPGFLAGLNPLRKAQRLCCRLLLNELAGKGVNLWYDSYGKPFLEGSQKHISVSHTSTYVAAIVNNVEATGIDIEQVRPKVMAVKEKFLSDAELNSASGENEVEKLCIYWAAKESLYKLYGRRDLLFKEDIRIEPFDTGDPGIISGTINKNGCRKTFNLKHEKTGDHVLVYVVNSL